MITHTHLHTQNTHTEKETARNKCIKNETWKSSRCTRWINNKVSTFVQQCYHPFLFSPPSKKSREKKERNENTKGDLFNIHASLKIYRVNHPHPNSLRTPPKISLNFLFQTFKQNNFVTFLPQ